MVISSGCRCCGRAVISKLLCSSNHCSRARICMTCYRVVIRDSRIARTPVTKPSGHARHEWLFRLRFAQGRVAQLDLAPILAAFASRSVISKPPRFARGYFAHAKLVISVETPWLRTSDAEHDEGVSRKPSLHAIRESRIASSPRDKMIPSLQLIQAFGPPTPLS
jgi:hypothetical protein